MMNRICPCSPGNTLPLAAIPLILGFGTPHPAERLNYRGFFADGAMRAIQQPTVRMIHCSSQMEMAERGGFSFSLLANFLIRHDLSLSTNYS